LGEKNIDVLSLGTNKWKENTSMCYLQAEVNGGKNIHELSSDFSKWKEKTSMCFLQA
jgi:hypothetical protein